MDEEKLSKVLPLALLDTMNFDKFIDNIKFNDRNHVFLRNIIQIFEDNKFQEKPFYVVVGAGHAPFLYEKLVKKGYEVRMNNWAQDAYDKHLLESASSTKSEL